MTLQDLKATLACHPDKPFRLLLPTGNQVPVSFHITEVGRVQKTFLDCGGRLHQAETCQLQAWVGGDDDHRIASGKMASILDKARAILPNDNIPVEIEYGDTAVSQYPVVDYAMDNDAVVLRLTTKQTDCLAKELCGAPGSGESTKTGCCDSKCGCD